MFHKNSFESTFKSGMILMHVHYFGSFKCMTYEEKGMYPLYDTYLSQLGTYLGRIPQM